MPLCVNCQEEKSFEKMLRIVVGLPDEQMYLLKGRERLIEELSTKVRICIDCAANDPDNISTSIEAILSEVLETEVETIEIHEIKELKVKDDDTESNK